MFNQNVEVEDLDAVLGALTIRLACAYISEWDGFCIRTLGRLVWVHPAGERCSSPSVGVAVIVRGGGEAVALLLDLLMEGLEVVWVPIDKGVGFLPFLAACRGRESGVRDAGVRSVSERQQRRTATLRGHRSSHDIKVNAVGRGWKAQMRCALGFGGNGAWPEEVRLCCRVLRGWVCRRPGITGSI